MEDFPNIPTDVQRQVLLRVPYILHDELKDVCRSWKEMMCSPQFYEDRKTCGTTQHLICLFHSTVGHCYNAPILYDPREGTCETIPIIPRQGYPNPLRFVYRWQFVSVNGKLVAFGECFDELEMPRRLKVLVIVYDFVSKEWRRGADMSTGRTMFACAASSSKGLIYVAGGQDEHGNSLATAEAYDVEEDRWEMLPPMTQNRHSSVGVYVEGKFMVISGNNRRFSRRGLRSAEVFDEEAGSWHTLENMWSLRRCIWEDCHVVCTCGKLYVIFKKETEVMKYNAHKNIWMSVTSVPKAINYVVCAAAWNDGIFVSGMANGNPIAYLFQPSTGQWIAVDVVQKFPPFYSHYYQGTVTIDI